MIAVEACGLCKGSRVKPSTNCGVCQGRGVGCSFCDGSGQIKGPNCARCWGRGTVPAGFLPADVILRVPPLTDTMGRTVIECAAGLLVATLALTGNSWRAVAWAEVRDLVVAAGARTEKPESTDEEKAAGFIWHAARNPFVRPNFGELEARGFAVRDASNLIGFTPEGIAAMAKWVPLSAPTAGAVEAG